MTVAPRGMTGWLVAAAAAPGVKSVGFSEAANAKLMWLLLEQLMRSPERGRALFPKPLSNQNKLWLEFRNYLRQAKSYWDSASLTAGTSAALPYYYAFLNLAKAELLITTSKKIYQTRVVHGISFNPTTSKSLRGDKLSVHDGVFPLLYEKRVGHPITEKKLEVPRLLGAVREIGMEVGETGLLAAGAVPFFQAVATDGDSAWSLIGSMEPNFLRDEKNETTKRFLKLYDEIALEDLKAYRDIFAISKRLISNEFVIYQSKQVFSLAPGKPDLSNASTYIRGNLFSNVEDAIGDRAEGILTSSLYSSRYSPMPGSLARYALMFYVSSLVRYKPSALDPMRHADTAWLLESFTKEAPLAMLVSAYSGIVGQTLQFESSGFRV